MNLSEAERASLSIPPTARRQSSDDPPPLDPLLAPLHADGGLEDFETPLPSSGDRKPPAGPPSTAVHGTSTFIPHTDPPEYGASGSAKPAADGSFDIWKDCDRGASVLLRTINTGTASSTSSGLRSAPPCCRSNSLPRTWSIFIARNTHRSSKLQRLSWSTVLHSVTS